jgi:hypothetical protein
MNTTTSNYLKSDHYMAAAKWVRGIEGTGKVKSIRPEEGYTTIRIESDSILRSTELASLVKLCKASGVEFAIDCGKYSREIIIIIDKA